VHPGQVIEFALTGEGQMPRQPQGPAMGMADGGVGGEAGGRPGGGIGAPIDTPDPLSKYKWWILSFLTILLVAGSAFFLRRREAVAGPNDHAERAEIPIAAPPVNRMAESRPSFPITAASVPTDAALLNVLKDELFALESEKLAGKISEEEYARVKVGLDALLKRLLQRTAMRV
jgi:hypothetical protein